MVGAGVIGLSTAITLAESGVDVRVLAAEPPRRTTSAVAGALWGPDFTEPGLGWSLVTRDVLTELAADPATGVHLCRGREVSDLQDEPPPWVDELPRMRPCTADELPPGMRVGLWTTVPIVDMPRYLDYLVARLTAAGVGVEQRRLTALSEVTGASTVVNCTGFGARELVGDTELVPVRGQHVIVRNPGVREFYAEARTSQRWAAFFPHGDRVVLGGVSQPGDERTEPDPADAEGILRRCAAVEPLLAGAEVIGHAVGLRPSRPEPRFADERVGDVRHVHNYGHGGLGVSLSWGSAHAVRDLLLS